MQHDKRYETAVDLAHGFYCGNCTPEQAREWKCLEDGCCSLRDGIYEELKAEHDAGMREVSKTWFTGENRKDRADAGKRVGRGNSETGVEQDERR